MYELCEDIAESSSERVEEEKVKETQHGERKRQDAQKAERKIVHYCARYQGHY